MLVAERQSKILDTIQTNGSAYVEDLAKDLKVSPMTIRRDLEKMQEEGSIERCHGGAVAKQEVRYEDKQISCVAEKQVLAKKCAQFVNEGDVLYLDAGTTTLEIAKCIRTIPDIMVVTNDLEIARYLKDSEVELMLCGGYVQKSTGSMYGYYATQMMAGFRFNVGFFGAASIDKEFQVLTPTIDKAFLKKQLAEKCQQSFLAVDDSKFFKQAMATINHLSDYTAVVTNHIFTEVEMKELQKRGTKIIQV